VGAGKVVDTLVIDFHPPANVDHVSSDT
jgi:hypothetical protein